MPTNLARAIVDAIHAAHVDACQDSYRGLSIEAQAVAVDRVLTRATDTQTAMDYLEGWTDESRHVIFVTPQPSGPDTDYVATCSCGWRDLPVVWRSQAAKVCPVLEILQERRKRMKGTR